MAGTTRKSRPGQGRDMRWLQKRHLTYFAVMEVPRGLRERLGKRRLLKSLGTEEHHIAVLRRHQALADFQKQFEAAGRDAGAASVADEALEWREHLQRAERTGYAAYAADAPIAADGRPVGDPRYLRWLAVSELEDAAEAIEDKHGLEAAKTFVGVAQGTATPLLMHLDAWLREGGVKGPLNPRTVAQYRSDLATLADWAKRCGVVAVEGFTDQVAGRFVTEELVSKGVHWATGNRKITAASAYWRWLRKRAGVKSNPWAGQSLSKGQAHRTGRSKRPFTDAEVAALLAGGADAELADAMRVAALSGMRIEEITAWKSPTARMDGSRSAERRRAPVCDVSRCIPLCPVSWRCGARARHQTPIYFPSPDRNAKAESVAWRPQSGSAITDNRSACMTRLTEPGIAASIFIHGAAGSSPPPVTPALIGRWLLRWSAMRPGASPMTSTAAVRATRY